MANDLDLGDLGGVQGENSLHAFIGHDPPHGDHAVDAATFHADQDALEDLGPLFATFDDALVHVNGVTD